MSLHHLDLTTALRPSLQTDETLLFVQDGVGLYEGKYKIPNCQNGQAYLTSHRACYVDSEEPRKHSVAINLKDVDHFEFYVRYNPSLHADLSSLYLKAGFLKSSPKITLHLKLSKRLSSGFPTSLGSRERTENPRKAYRSGGASPVPTASPSPGLTGLPSNTIATWVCTICSFSNPLPSNFHPTTATSNASIPDCLSCGIKPQRLHLLKAAIANASQRPSNQGPLQLTITDSFTTSFTNDGRSDVSDTEDNVDVLSPSSLRALRGASAKEVAPCPRCTFLNHSSLSICEICGALLKSRSITRGTLEPPMRTESPGPSLSSTQPIEETTPENVKLSFRAGGEKIFYERLKGAIIQRKWLLADAPSLPKPSDHLETFTSSSGHDSVSRQLDASSQKPKIVGIAALEQRSLETRSKNASAITSAFSDLEALMSSAKEIITLAESFSSQLPPSAPTTGSSTPDTSAVLPQSTIASLGLITTKDTSSSAGETSLYHTLLSRTLADLLTDDHTGILKREGGIISLVDLWALFNRARGGVELVSPSDFLRSCEMFEKLKLPLRLRKFKSGLLAVQGSDMDDPKVISRLITWMEAPTEAVELIEMQFGRAITPRDAAEKFGWSVGVAREELEMAEEKGALCREEGIGGVRFWRNWIVRLSHDHTNE